MVRNKAMWIFAYGSLIFRPGFSYVERRRAYLRGWARRFWQGSPDHRGVPESPGRVVTLVPSEGDHCGGCAFRLEPEELERVLPSLDHREKAGFERRLLPMWSDASSSGETFAEGITWVANEANAHFLGALPEHEIADYVRDRHGPSGANADYVRDLHRALLELEIADAHVEAVISALLSPGPRTR